MKAGLGALLLLHAARQARALLHDALLSAMLERHRYPSSTIPAPAAWQRIAEAERAASDDMPPADGDAPPLSALYARAATDGELLDAGVSTLLEHLQLDDTSVFADLGSGRGGALLRVAAAAPQCRTFYGVELLKPKHDAAARLLSAVRGELPTTAAVELRNGDVIELAALAAPAPPPPPPPADAPSDAAAPPRPLSELTHAYTCSVCFDDFLLRRVAAALADRALFPRFQALVSLRTLPPQPHLVRVGGFPLCCSWNAAVSAHAYVPADVLARDEVPLGLLARCLCADGVCTLPPALQWPPGTMV